MLVRSQAYYERNESVGRRLGRGQWGPREQRQGRSHDVVIPCIPDVTIRATSAAAANRLIVPFLPAWTPLPARRCGAIVHRARGRITDTSGWLGNVWKRSWWNHSWLQLSLFNTMFYTFEGAAMTNGKYINWRASARCDVGCWERIFSNVGGASYPLNVVLKMNCVQKSVIFHFYE